MCLFFANQAYTGLLVWYLYRQPFPAGDVWLLPAAALVACNYRVALFGSVLAAIAALDTAHILSVQIGAWLDHGQLYINELMVKKFALCGAVPGARGRRRGTHPQIPPPPPPLPGWAPRA